ncbi:MAG: hypothetical protein J7L07_07090 [Candidatus Odinarchaeota archaeon]|nr:hypothetical protein [Candidatus Odinarchaeota archaeon]
MSSHQYISTGCSQYRLEYYLNTIITRINSFLSKNREKLQKADINALEYFENLITKYYKNPYQTVDFCICDSRTSEDLKDAIRKANKILGRDESSIPQVADILIHFVGCNIAIVEVKRVKSPDPRKTEKAILQIRSLFKIYNELFVSGKLSQWIFECTGIMPTFYKGALIKKYGAIGLVHINYIDSHTKENRLVDSFMGRKGKKRITLEKNPYIIITARLETTRFTKQTTLF